jgi:hypothetical protein
LLGQDFVESLVDERQRRAHAHRCPVGFEDPGVAGEDGHARPDASLSQIHWRDVALLQVAECGWHFMLQGSEEVTP